MSSPSSPPPPLLPGANVFADKDELRDGINEWEHDPVATEQARGHINAWDTSNVTDMSALFRDRVTFNTTIDRWDTSRVTSMSGMFRNATSFEQDVDGWNVSRVVDLSHAFRSAGRFNQPLDSWDVSSATTFIYMFYLADRFNQPLDSWDVSSATYFRWMFSHAENFNQPLDGWDVSSATSFFVMFNNAGRFNQPLDSWNVSRVTTFGWMFDDCTSFNQPLGSWDVSSATTFSHMFDNCTSFNQPLGSWDVSSATTFSHMFDFTTSFDNCNKARIHAAFAHNDAWPYSSWASSGDCPPLPSPPPTPPPPSPSAPAWAFTSCQITFSAGESGAAGAGFQLAEFDIYDGGTQANYSGATISPPINYCRSTTSGTGYTSRPSSSGVEPAGRIMDDNIATKCCCETADLSSDITLTVTFTQPTPVTSYDLITADDDHSRDPTAWTFSCRQESGSSSWMLLDTQTVTPPTARFASYGPYTLSFPPSPPLPSSPLAPPPPINSSPPPPLWRGPNPHNNQQLLMPDDSNGNGCVGVLNRSGQMLLYNDSHCDDAYRSCDGFYYASCFGCQCDGYFCEFDSHCRTGSCNNGTCWPPPINSVDDFVAAVGDASVSQITLAAGVYHLSTNQCGTWACSFHIQRSLTIQAAVGASVVLDASGTGGRMLWLTSPADVTIRGITLTGGSTVGSGGCIRIEGNAALRLLNCDVTGNTANSGSGGGIAVYGKLMLADGSQAWEYLPKWMQCRRTDVRAGHRLHCSSRALVHMCEQRAVRRCVCCSMARAEWA